jgi:hypothetical protein
MSITIIWLMQPIYIISIVVLIIISPAQQKKIVHLTVKIKYNTYNIDNHKYELLSIYLFIFTYLFIIYYKNIKIYKSI